MIKTEIKVLQEFLDFPFPKTLINSDYDFIYDNSIVAGYAYRVLKGEKLNRTYVEELVKEEFTSNIENVIQSVTNENLRQELLCYQKVYTHAVEYLINSTISK